MALLEVENKESRDGMAAGWKLENRNWDHEGMLYEPSWANGTGSRWLEVRFTGSTAPLIPGIRQAVQEQDPNVPLLRVRMMKDYINTHFAMSA